MQTMKAHMNIRFFEIYKNYVSSKYAFTDGLTIPTSALAETFNEFNRESMLAKFYYSLIRMIVVFLSILKRFLLAITQNNLLGYSMIGLKEMKRKRWNQIHIKIAL